MMRKIAKYVALGLIVVITFIMSRKFGFEAGLGVVLTTVVCAIYAVILYQETEEQTFTEIWDSLERAIDEIERKDNEKRENVIKGGRDDAEDDA